MRLKDHCLLEKQETYWTKKGRISWKTNIICSDKSFLRYDQKLIAT